MSYLESIIGYCERKHYALGVQVSKQPVKTMLTYLFFTFVGCAVGGGLTGYLAKRYSSLKNPGFLIIGMTCVGGMLTTTIVIAPEIIGERSCRKKNRALLKAKIAEWVTDEGRPTPLAMEKISAVPGMNELHTFYTIQFARGASSFRNTIAVEFHLEEGQKGAFEVPAVPCLSLFEVPVYYHEGNIGKGINPAFNRDEQGHGVVFACIQNIYLPLIAKGEGRIVVKIIDSKKTLMVTYPDCKIVNEPYPHLLVDNKCEYSDF